MSWGESVTFWTLVSSVWSGENITSLIRLPWGAGGSCPRGGTMTWNLLWSIPRKFLAVAHCWLSGCAGPNYWRSTAGAHCRSPLQASNCRHPLQASAAAPIAGARCRRWMLEKQSTETPGQRNTSEPARGKPALPPSSNALPAPLLTRLSVPADSKGPAFLSQSKQWRLHLALRGSYW